MLPVQPTSNPEVGLAAGQTRHHQKESEFLKRQVALVRAENFLISDPLNPHWLFKQAFLLAGLKDFQKALDVLDRFQAPGFLETEIALVRARALAGLGHDEKALIAIKQALERDPSSFRLYLAGVHLYNSKGRWKEAEELAGPALAIIPEKPIGKKLKAQILHDLGKYPEAFALIQDILKDSPNDVSARKFARELRNDLKKGRKNGKSSSQTLAGHPMSAAAPAPFDSAENVRKRSEPNSYEEEQIPSFVPGSAAWQGSDLKADRLG